MARLLSVNVGFPRDITWKGRTVHTGIWKNPVRGRCRVRRLNLDGDGQGDLAGHGGEHRAVFVYQIESYRYWQEQLKRDDFVYGQFGENFTIEGLADDAVCIGDRYQIGTALFEVTQPRVTCFRVGIGSGQSGPFLAVRMAAAEQRVAIIERHRFGGTCVNRGCIPTKTLVASAYSAHRVRRAADFGVQVDGTARVDMKRVKARKHRLLGNRVCLPAQCPTATALI